MSAGGLRTRAARHLRGIGGPKSQHMGGAITCPHREACRMCAQGWHDATGSVAVKSPSFADCLGPRSERHRADARYIKVLFHVLSSISLPRLTCNTPNLLSGFLLLHSTHSIKWQHPIPGRPVILNDFLHFTTSRISRALYAYKCTRHQASRLIRLQLRSPILRHNQ